MHYQERPLSDLYRVKDIMLVIALILVVIPIAISFAWLMTSR